MEYIGKQEAMILICEDDIEVTPVVYLTDYCAISTELKIITKMHLNIWFINLGIFASWIAICVVW